MLKYSVGEKMKIRIINIFLLSALFFVNVDAQKKTFRKLENNAFRVGEKLTFDVKYGFVTAGVAIINS